MLQWGHRFTSVETDDFLKIDVSYFKGFNGATDLHRWKPVEGIKPSIEIQLLQWGHRFTSVETGDNPIRPSEARSSFNGATDLHRWKLINHLPIIKNPVSFNGATDLHRWKRRHTKTWNRKRSKLQWGHRFTSVETNPSKYNLFKDKRLQWGHRFTSVETVLHYTQKNH